MIDNGSNLAGKVLGTYMLETLIGRGGMSVVYQAQQLQSTRRVAVKILLPGAPIGSELHNQFLARFQREAKIIARLHHANIIPNYEYGEQDGETYLVMPLLTGGSLRDLLERRGRFSLPETTYYIEQAATALDYAHKLGVIHRDLKPSNFLLDADDRLVLADFGIAHIMRDSGRSKGWTLTIPGIVLGTPDYMSPEMAQGELIDHRSDIYQLGIVLFQMLSGDVPFKGNTASVLIKHVKENPPLLHTIHPAIPSAVDDVIQKATAKRREDRFASASEMAQALHLAIDAPPSHRKGNTTNYAPTVLAAMASLPTYDAFTSSVDQSGTSKTEAGYPSNLSLPSASATKPRRLRDILAIFLIIFAFILVIGAIPLGLWMTGLPQGQSKPPARQGSSLSQSQQARATVQQYYDCWNRGAYQDAYNLLASGYRQNHSYNSLLDSYRATRHTSLQIISATPLADGSVKVTIIDTATEEDTPGTLTTHIYNGYYIVKPEDGAWKLYPHFTY